MTPTPNSRTDGALLPAAASLLPIGEVVGRLRDLLGDSLIASIAGVSEPRAVREWQAGGREPRRLIRERLRLALRLALELNERHGEEAPRAWFESVEPMLGDRSPSRILAEGDPEIVGTRLLEAARVPREDYLRAFFALSSPDNGAPSVAIVYPPRETNEEVSVANMLLPPVAAEDFFAVQHIAGCLSDIGVQDYVHVATSVWDAKRSRNRNKVFVCMRNKPGLDMLEALKDQARFSFEHVSDRRERCIRWRTTRGEEAVVHSPLATYLEVQPAPTASEPWCRRRVAVDFGVLARFKDLTAQHPQPSIIYVTGLRALGTWGAAWYLRRRIEAFGRRLRPDEPAQLLLRVEYRDDHIDRVHDVSDWPQERFDAELDDSRIGEMIATPAT